MGHQFFVVGNGAQHCKIFFLLRLPAVKRKLWIKEGPFKRLFSNNLLIPQNINKLSTIDERTLKMQFLIYGFHSFDL